MRYTKNICEKITNLSYESLPKEVVQRAKEVILDTIGVTLAGLKSDSANILNEYIDLVGGYNKESTVIGRNKQTSSVHAALINTATGHALDYDDVSWSTIGHPGVVTVAPALALGEKYKSTGKELITAIVAGYETMSAIGRGVVPDFMEKGWHSTATIGPFGSVATCGKMLNLGVEEMVTAFGIIGSLAAGVKGNMGTMTKHLQVGRAAANGVTAVLLAQKGFTASDKILEGKDCFCSVFAPKYKLDVMVESFCNPFDLTSSGALFKKWPSCYSTNPCIEAALKLSEEYDIVPEDVEKIEIASTPLVLDVLFYNEPKTADEGKFSDQFCAAVALTKRRASIEEFTDEVVNDPKIRELIKKTTLITDSELSEDGYALSSDKGPTKTRVTITLKNGQKLSEVISIAKGAPQRRLSIEEVTEKYESCAKYALQHDDITKSIELVMKLEKMENISPLMDILGG